MVHLHSTYATALSRLADIDPDDAIPPVTPYVVMRVGRVPLVPYTHPGAADVKPLILAKAPDHAAVLLWQSRAGGVVEDARGRCARGRGIGRNCEARAADARLTSASLSPKIVGELDQMFRPK